MAAELSRINHMIRLLATRPPVSSAEIAECWLTYTQLDDSSKERILAILRLGASKLARFAAVDVAQWAVLEAEAAKLNPQCVGVVEAAIYRISHVGYRQAVAEMEGLLW